MGWSLPSEHETWVQRLPNELQVDIVQTSHVHWVCSVRVYLQNIGNSIGLPVGRERTCPAIFSVTGEPVEVLCSLWVACPLGVRYLCIP